VANTQLYCQHETRAADTEPELGSLFPGAFIFISGLLEGFSSPRGHQLGAIKTDLDFIMERRRKADNANDDAKEFDRNFAKSLQPKTTP
jgi:hypothetical protein